MPQIQFSPPASHRINQIRLRQRAGKGRHFEAPLILQAVCWYLRYSLSYRDIEELFRERGLAVDHSTLNRWSWPTRR
jgi:transposase-like protein